MQFFPYGVGNGKHYKLSELTTVEKGQMPQEIAKENQQYRLCLQYEYIGSNEMMAITTSRSRYWRLSFSPHDQLLLSDSAV